MKYAPTLTDQKFDSLLSIESSARYILGCMQYAPTLMDQKLEFLLSIKSPARYVLGRMQYAPTLTDQKIDSILSIESPARYVFGRMQYTPTHTDQKIDSPLKSPTHNNPFFVYLCRGVLHTPYKCPWQWSFESPARYVSIKYVFIESYTRQKLDSPSPIESYTRQKLDSSLKRLTRNNPFSVYQCRGVLHTPHKRPRQGRNESICHSFFEYT